ncbi:transient receptor potential cation channel subfamily V member 5-like isoform X3 [Littorina saxatilis]|uniref:transient receptor potential cation channel subfamily V member 5-like isoform X3 n=1 Tax=Littorina saxatilis TaxID=31220 RepID=UPI0038B433B8
MGNTSVVASGVKAQGDVAASELYSLVALGDGGELFELAKEAMKSVPRDYTKLDQVILTKVKKFLYAGGEGRKVPIAELVQFRNRDRETSIKISKDKQKKANDLAMLDILTQQDDDVPNKQAADRKYRLQCWDLDKRGTVGESILHLCMLSATQIHFDLAKRLIQFFPNLINDIYLGEEYYGESVLHIAIVNEDPAMVKFLLDRGADYHVRACGNFFCPDDQKASRTDCLEHEWVNVCENTNYDGYVYWGEYPLSFAACLGQEECVRLLLAKGADPNLQDTNGNTVLHMLVIHDKKKLAVSEEEAAENKSMFDLILNNGGRLDIKNRRELTPLTLAGKLARKDMYEHVLEKERQVFWIYGTVTCAGYPLASIDTISPSGEINHTSALNLIVYGEDESHLNMMDGLIVDLLQEKWKTFVRSRFYRRFILFIIYFCMFVTAFALRPGQDLCAYRNDTSGLTGCSQTGSNRTVDPCYLLRPYRHEDIGRLVLEACVLLGAIIYILLAMKEIHHQGFHVFFTTLKGAPAKALMLLSTMFVVAMLPGRAFCAHEYEDIMGVLAILSTAPYFLFFCRGFKIVGPFVTMIYSMIKGDLLRFFIIYAIFVIGFSQAMYIVFQGVEGSSFVSPGESVMGMFIMSLGQFADFYDSFVDTKYPIMGKIIFMVYMIMVTLLLVNMLIAMMGNTYELVSNTQKEWFRQWAKIVLMIEQSVTPRRRVLEQIKYTQPMADGKGRVFVVRWHQTEKEKDELMRLRIQNKIQQKTMAQRKNTMRIFNSTRKLKAAAKLLTKTAGDPRTGDKGNLAPKPEG